MNNGTDRLIELMVIVAVAWAVGFVMGYVATKAGMK